MSGDSQLPPSALATDLPLCFHFDFKRSGLLTTAALGEQSESRKSKLFPEPLSLFDSAPSSSQTLSTQVIKADESLMTNAQEYQLWLYFDLLGKTDYKVQGALAGYPM